VCFAQFHHVVATTTFSHPPFFPCHVSCLSKSTSSILSSTSSQRPAHTYLLCCTVAPNVPRQSQHQVIVSIETSLSEETSSASNLAALPCPTFAFVVDCSSSYLLPGMNISYIISQHTTTIDLPNNSDHFK